jgi:hypothetical protein
MGTRIGTDATTFPKDEALYSPTVQVQRRHFLVTVRTNGIVFNFLRFFHFGCLLVYGS